MGLKRVSWVRRYQGQCRALRPLEHQGYRLRSYKKDQPLCSGYREWEPGGLSSKNQWNPREGEGTSGAKKGSRRAKTTEVCHSQPLDRPAK